MKFGAAAEDARGWHGRRRFAVAEDLDRFHGPTTGASPLPLRLQTPRRAAYDFGDAHQRAEAHRVVLLEAFTQDDLASWLDRDELLRVWLPYLPREIRAAWQARHPVLAARRGGPERPAAVGVVPLDPLRADVPEGSGRVDEHDFRRAGR